MYLFHAECSVRGVVTDLVVCHGITYIKPPMFWKKKHTCHIIGQYRRGLWLLSKSSRRKMGVYFRTIPYKISENTLLENGRT